MKLLEPKKHYEIDKKDAVKACSHPNQARLVRQAISDHGTTYCDSLNYSTGKAMIASNEYGVFLGCVQVPISCLKPIRDGFRLVG